MLDKNLLISNINKTCKNFFTESSFYLHPSSANRFKISGDNSSIAINNHGSYLEEVNVIKWFSDFWIYLDIRFENRDTFISLSIFQGKNSENKHQLFRAEWDDYNMIDKHPQPHWHITSNQVIEKTFTELADMDDNDTFVKLLEEEKSRIIDINKIHFAMCGNWIQSDVCQYPLNNEKEILSWFQGLLSHLRIQLEYVK